MKNEQQDHTSVFQLLTTLLALLLPLLQFLFTLIPKDGNALFLFKDYFVVTSVLAAVISYVFIIGYSNVLYFELPLNFKLQKKYKEFLNKTNGNYYTADTIQKYINKHGITNRPFYITPQNIYTPFAILLLTTFVIFLYLGVFHKGSSDKMLIFIQLISYILSVALLTLTLAVFYINQRNRDKFEKSQATLFKRVIDIAIFNNAITEYPNITFIAQQPIIANNTVLTLFRSNNTFYKIVSDGDVRRINTVERYNSLESLYESLANQGGQ